MANFMKVLLKKKSSNRLQGNAGNVLLNFFFLSKYHLLFCEEFHNCCNTREPCYKLCLFSVKQIKPFYSHFLTFVFSTIKVKHG